MKNKTVVTKPVWVNKTSPIFTVQHEPKSGKFNKTGVIILSSGFLHNIGPYRLNVDIANYLSSLGFVVVRVDQSGKGDSPARLDVVGLDAKLADYDDLFENMKENFNIENTILIGLCSGADDGLEISSQRDSVSGMVFLDGFSPVTFWYHFNHYYTRLRHFRAWRRWKEKVKNSKQFDHQSGDEKASATNVEYNSGMSLRRWQSENKVKEMYERALKRNCKVLAVFSGNAGDYYNHQGQLTRGLKYASKTLSEIYFSKATHIYTHPDDRKLLVKSIADWGKSSF